MLRILHVVTTMNRGGLETMIMNYYRHIDREKIQFDFLVHRDFKADYDDEILALGGKIFHLPTLNPFNKTYYDKVNNFFNEHPEYKIIHVHQDCLSSIMLKIAKKHNVQIRIAHSHNANQDRNLKYLIKKYYMRSIPKYATDLFACGKEAGDWMFRGEPYTIMNNAIESYNFIYTEMKKNEVRKSLNIKEKDIIIGHVGRFNPQKNHNFLIDVFNEIHKYNNNAKLMLVGTGDLMDSIKEKAKSLNILDSIIFMGNRSDVNELMQAMDIFVFPSHYEGLPVTIVEAQASGLPIFISKNIPNQCMMTPYIWSLSLDDNAKYWSDYILDKYKEFKRVDTQQYIIDAKFDIKENAKWLQEFYLSKL